MLKWSEENWGWFLGALLYFTFYGVHDSNPYNLGWIFTGRDNIQHFLGLKFFCSEPWHLPPGLIKNWPAPLGTSITFSDSLPLFSFPTKLLGLAGRGRDFQFWEMARLVFWSLSGFFAWRLGGLITRDRFQRFILAVLFCCSPLCLHSELITQAFFLWVVYLYVNEDESPQPAWSWLLLLVLSALVHPYILFANFCFWLACFISKRRGNLIYLTVNALVLSLTVWCAGYFVIGTNATGGGGFGHFSMNLLSLVDPAGLSAILPRLPTVTSGQYVGFAYLGAGLLVMAVLSMVRATMSLRELIQSLKRPKILCLLCACVFLTILALSPKIALGGKTVFVYSIPGFLAPLTNVIRGSGRLFNPVYHFLVFSVALFSMRSFKEKYYARLFLISVLVLQFYDLKPIFLQFTHRSGTAGNWKSENQVPTWKSTLRFYKHAFVITDRVYENPVGLGYSAADEGLTLNMGYLARADYEAMQGMIISTMKELEKNRYDSETLYAQDLGFDWPGIKRGLKCNPYDGFSIIGDYLVFAPGWYSNPDRPREIMLHCDDFRRTWGTRLPLPSYKAIYVSSVFDWRYYRDQNPDLAHMNENELKQHWDQFGIAEGRCGHPSFCPKVYYSAHSEIQKIYGPTEYRSILLSYVSASMPSRRASGAHALPQSPQ